MTPLLLPLLEPVLRGVDVDDELDDEDDEDDVKRLRSPSLCAVDGCRMPHCRFVNEKRKK